METIILPLHDCLDMQTRVVINTFRLNIMRYDWDAVIGSIVPFKIIAWFCTLINDVLKTSSLKIYYNPLGIMVVSLSKYL